MSLDGIMGEETGLNAKNVLVVIYVEFGWLETTIDLLVKFGALPKGERAQTVDGRVVYAHMFEVCCYAPLEIVSRDYYHALSVTNGKCRARSVLALAMQRISCRQWC